MARYQGAEGSGVMQCRQSVQDYAAAREDDSAECTRPTQPSNAHGIHGFKLAVELG
jgi:hypothetical protein